jgi:hypothetical protein
VHWVSIGHRDERLQPLSRVGKVAMWRRTRLESQFLTRTRLASVWHRPTVDLAGGNERGDPMLATGG